MLILYIVIAILNYSERPDEKETDKFWTML